MQAHRAPCAHALGCSWIGVHIPGARYKQSYPLRPASPRKRWGSGPSSGASPAMASTREGGGSVFGGRRSGEIPALVPVPTPTPQDNQPRQNDPPKMAAGPTKTPKIPSQNENQPADLKMAHRKMPSAARNMAHRVTRPPVFRGLHPACPSFACPAAPCLRRAAP